MIDIRTMSSVWSSGMNKPGDNPSNNKYTTRVDLR